MAAAPLWHASLSPWSKPSSRLTAVSLSPRPSEAISRRRGSHREITFSSGFGFRVSDLMNILLASSEVHPFSKTGGLADMVGALGKALARCGNKVGIVTPLYLGIRERFPQLKRLDLPLDLPLGIRRVRGEVWSLEPEAGPAIYFLDTPEFYQRASLYDDEGVDYPDNAERFIFFTKAFAHRAQHLPWKPEILHGNDWQTGLAALLLHHQAKLA